MLRFLIYSVIYNDIAHIGSLFSSYYFELEPGAYAGFLKGGGANFKISGILDIHAAKRHVASSDAASLC